MEFKDFSRTSPKIQGLFKTVRTLKNLGLVGVLEDETTAFSLKLVVK